MGHEEGAQAIPLDQELNQMSRRELQDLAKVLGVKANTKSKVIIEKIGAMRGKVNEEECVEAAKELVGDMGIGVWGAVEWWRGCNGCKCGLRWNVW